MDFGKVEYVVEAGDGNGRAARKIKLTLIGQGDEDILRLKGLAGLRRKRILRLAKEAEMQGSLLGYEDLSGLLLTSLATLKRDVSHMERQGYTVPLRGRRKNGNGNTAFRGKGTDGE